MTTATGQPDWPWIIALIVLSIGVVLAYLRIYVFWCRAYLSVDRRDRNGKLMQLAHVFLWCAICGYASSILMFVWPAYRLVAVCLVVLNIWSWRFAANLGEFGVSFSARRFRRLAETDSLTGLLNRDAVSERIASALQRLRRQDDRGTGILYVDFDRFKTVNDCLGHEAGDELLRQIGERLAAFCAEHNEKTKERWCAGRMGGDEFVLLGENVGHAAHLRAAGGRLLVMLRQPFTVVGRGHRTSASIGIRLAREGDSASDVLRDADLAMYEAKSSGRGRIIIFDRGMQDRAQRRLQLEGDLHAAIEKERLHIAYQPIVRLDTGEVSGAEALARWEHSTYGTIAPDEFIPIAEDTLLIIRLGRWMMRAACRQLRLWHDHFGDTKLTMNVNVAPQQIQAPGFVNIVAAAINDAGVPASCVHIEITERSFIADTERSARTLTRLRKLGVKINMDDFGTGYSSLSHLHSLPLDRLKLDRSFTENIVVHGEYSAVLRAVTMLAADLGIDVLAEGVESKEQVEVLRTLNCAYGQGYLFGRPCSADDFPAIVQRQAIAAANVRPTRRSLPLVPARPAPPATTPPAITPRQSAFNADQTLPSPGA